MNIDKLTCFRKYLDVQLSQRYFLHQNLNIAKDCIGCLNLKIVSLMEANVVQFNMQLNAAFTEKY